VKYDTPEGFGHLRSGWRVENVAAGQAGGATGELGSGSVATRKIGCTKLWPSMWGYDGEIISLIDGTHPEKHGM
jgi:hypothetical protein